MVRLEESFGRKVQALRTGTGMTQSQLAEAIDMSVEWVRRIENGGASPSFDTIAALAKALNVRPQDLFADASPPLANKVAVAVQGLSEEQVQWLIDGARLFQRAAESVHKGRAKPSRVGRASVPKPTKKRP